MRKQITLRDDQYKFYKMMNSEKLLIAFIEFMFEDIEPNGLSENEQILFDSLRVRMELQKTRSDAGSNSHGGGRPKKTTNDESKETTKKQQKNNTLNNKKTTNKTTNKTTKKQEDKDKDKEIRYKEEDINNNIILTNDSEQSSQYGNEEINECMNIIKSFNNGIINGSEKKGRQYSNNLIKKLKAINNVKKGKITRQQILQMVLTVAKENEFHSTKTTSPELIYYNLSTLLDVARNEFKKQQGSKTLHAL